MKKLIGLLFFSPTLFFGQVPKDSELFLQLQKKDSLLFEVGFNQCNIKVLEEITSEDLEFYHDVGGIQNKEGFLNATAENICGDSERKITRLLVPGSLEVFELKNNNEVYGVLQRGAHWFYIETPSEEKHRTGYAKFTSLWLLENTNWRLKRVISFDHRAEDH